jgi:prepilin-type N-terminal cleavage/methylation domain-containing protein
MMPKGNANSRLVGPVVRIPVDRAPEAESAVKKAYIFSGHPLGGPRPNYGGRMIPRLRDRPLRCTRRRVRGGLSLIEVIIAVLILGIVSAAGGLRYAAALQNAGVGQAARRLAADIETARHAARSRRQAVTITFDTTNHSYQLVGLVDPDRPSAASTTVKLNAYSPSITLSSASFGGDASLQFNAFGVPDSGGTAQITWGTFSQTVTVAAGTGSVSVP